MDVAREDELDLGDPLLDRLRLGLRPLVVLLEVVGEVPVQVEPPRVVPKIKVHSVWFIGDNLKQFGKSLFLPQEVVPKKSTNH